MSIIDVTFNVIVIVERLDDRQTVVCFSILFWDFVLHPANDRAFEERGSRGDESSDDKKLRGRTKLDIQSPNVMVDNTLT